MTLSGRLSTVFLGVIALILVGFSAALYVMASLSLHRSADDRLESALNTLAALAEDEPGGFDWEPDDRQITLGRDPGEDQIRWFITNNSGKEVDRSRNLKDAGVLANPNSRVQGNGDLYWRIATRRLVSMRLEPPDPEVLDRSSHLILHAGLQLGPVDRSLQALALSLCVLSATIWGMTALVGRRLCRSALAPLSRMEATARGLTTDEPGRRLPVAATGDELEGLARAFNGLLDRWQEALERQASFSGDASHQLRTPLAAVIGQVDVALRRDREPEEYRRTLARVRDQSERLRRIVESSFSWPERTRRPASPRSKRSTWPVGSANRSNGGRPSTRPNSSSCSIASLPRSSSWLTPPCWPKYSTIFSTTPPITAGPTIRPRSALNATRKWWRSRSRITVEGSPRLICLTSSIPFIEPAQRVEHRRAGLAWAWRWPGGSPDRSAGTLRPRVRPVRERG